MAVYIWFLAFFFLVFVSFSVTESFVAQAGLQFTR